MDHGRLVEHGTHHMLLQRGSLYAQLVDAQLTATDRALQLTAKGGQPEGCVPQRRPLTNGVFLPASAVATTGASRRNIDNRSLDDERFDGPVNAFSTERSGGGLMKPQSTTTTGQR
jgi:hypothetical protein